MRTHKPENKSLEASMSQTESGGGGFASEPEPAKQEPEATVKEEPESRDE